MTSELSIKAAVYLQTKGQTIPLSNKGMWHFAGGVKPNSYTHQHLFPAPAKLRLSGGLRV